MKFRRANEKDILQIMKIIKQAQASLKASNIDQWQNNYPTSQTIRNDIANNDSYVLVDKSFIIGTIAVIYTGEATYEYIYDGKWLSCSSYAAIHRIAVAEKYKGMGIASAMLDNVCDQCSKLGVNSLRIDTHRDNISMQKLLLKNGFKYCGIIYLEDGNKRLAYEKLI